MMVSMNRSLNGCILVDHGSSMMTHTAADADSSILDFVKS